MDDDYDDENSLYSHLMSKKKANMTTYLKIVKTKGCFEI
jgi:hypothetical protein